MKTNAAKVKKTLAAVKFSKLTGILVHSSDFAFADNHITAHEGDLPAFYERFGFKKEERVMLMGKE
ncbi:MAG: hypothetical protein Q4F82_09925 [bacterium]|nr:hypothetical protein [bacterium]